MFEQKKEQVIDSFGINDVIVIKDQEKWIRN